MSIDERADRGRRIRTLNTESARLERLDAMLALDSAAMGDLIAKH